MIFKYELILELYWILGYAGFLENYQNLPNDYVYGQTFAAERQILKMKPHQAEPISTFLFEELRGYLN